MNRWNPVNVNTPEYFDVIWPQWADAEFNVRRMRVMTDSVPRSSTVVDLGAGYLGCGMYLALQPEFTGKIVAVDFCKTAAEMTRAKCGDRISYVVGNVCNTPLKSASFDYGFLGEVIEHVESPVALLQELRRVLKVGGTGYISTVDMHCTTAKRNGCRYPDHVWDFTLQSFHDVLASVFSDVCAEKVGNYYIGVVK